MKFPTNLFSASLCLPEEAMVFELSRIIRQAAHDLAVLETDDYYFNPVGFADSGACELVLRDDAYGHWAASWSDNTIEQEPRNAVFDIVWRDQRFTVVTVCKEFGKAWFIVGESLSACERFFAAVCQWNTVGDNAVTVFDEGYFERDEELREEIRERRLDDLVLPAGIRKQLQEGVLEFFQQREWYTESGLQWKRGVIMHGPPGNGKTQTIRALINESNHAAIYVRSLWGYRVPPQICLKRIYERARDIAPSIVVLEDIDSLIQPQIRSYFLNELDGMRKLDGVMTIATTNHLETLDVAIRNRPSRFDVKIEFANPDPESRTVYLVGALGIDNLAPEVATDVVKRTAGMSFAALQEFARSCSARRREMDLEKAVSETLDDMAIEAPVKKKDKKKKSGSK